ncbi:MAG: hypothetical protein ACRD2L_05590, partial [Terriglobia bacterium]
MTTKSTLTIATTLVTVAALVGFGILPTELTASTRAISEDPGDVAMVVDNGLIVTERSPFDLPNTTLRFEPAAAHSYVVSRSPAGLEGEFGPALTFGFPGASAPLDDDSEEVAFPPGFPFFGTTYTSLFVSTNGEITFT